MDANMAPAEHLLQGVASACHDSSITVNNYLIMLYVLKFDRWDWIGTTLARWISGSAS
jgi:hypothetical protein